MVWAFEFSSSEEHWNAPPEDWERAQKGIELFAEHFFELWT